MVKILDVIDKKKHGQHSLTGNIALVACLSAFLSCSFRLVPYAQTHSFSPILSLKSHKVNSQKMSTSILVSSDPNTNLTLSEDIHHHSRLQTTTTRHDRRQTSKQSSASGARRKPSKGNESNRKQPQRGMGVAQLERLRLMTEINQLSPPPSSLPYAVIPTSFAHDTTSLNTVPVQLTTKFVGYPSNVVGNNSGVGLVHEGLISENKFQDNLHGAVNETSKELSSTPNVIKCYSDHCSVCHQKKCNVSGENLVFKGSVKDMNAEMPSITSSDFVGLNVGIGKKATYSVGNVDQCVEVVAVHRKGSLSGDGSGSLLMEYEFFPSRTCGRSETHESDQNELMMMLMKKVGSSEYSSSVTAAVMVSGAGASCATTNTGGDVAVDASNSIDLSLRLSY